MSGVIGRRRLLAGVAGAFAAVPLVSCSGGTGSSPGRLRVAFPAGGATESLDPHTGSLFVDQARAKALFDTLVGYADDMSVVPRLAESWQPDPTGTRWRIRLRPAQFHDGRPVTAEDVLYTYRRIADESTAAQAGSHFADVDFGASKAISATELELVLGAPNFEFPAAWGAPATEIVPAGTTDFTAPVGSGPFRYVSFEPGKPAVFARFDGHWSGPATLAELEFVPMEEESARVNALLSGQVDYAHDVSANSVRLLEQGGRARVFSAPFGTMQALLLKVDRPPFSDPRLVRAVRAGLDRRALLDIALSGQGRVGNDLFGAGLRFYPADLPEPARDPELARSLLREAGADGLTWELQTSTVDPYFESAAGLISQQLGEVGMRVTPRVGPSETYFSDIKKNGVASLSRTAALPVPTFLGQRMTSDAGSNNYTGYHSAEFDALHAEALSTADDARRADLLATAQRLSREQSGMVVWGFSGWNVATSDQVSGVRGAPPNSLDWARFDRVSVG
ncbi:ABC transporter substrate-binding protein [Saccharopolyspora gloriosae]|uniref:ABC transporter substrate-binding protein n=1 Tax=Saccharopolyspora gloriosae TaxID=455344 RepID=UPI002867F1E8|nr:ABC transporter substrate-binding protein [Saccharopolyspora gloriosae]